jgi:hypothetical protein
LVSAVTDLIEEQAAKASQEYNVRHIKKTLDLVKVRRYREEA